MVLAVLAVALAGCGALSGKLGAPMNASLLERTDGSPHAESSVPSGMVAAPAVPPAEVRAEMRLAAASRTDDVVTDAPNAEFMPVSFEPMPPGSASHLLASPDRTEGPPLVMVAQTGGASETKPAETTAAESKS